MVLPFGSANAQNVTRELELGKGGMLHIVNFYGRVDVIAETSPVAEGSAESAQVQKASLSATSKKSLAESEVKVGTSGEIVKVEISPSDPRNRIDLAVKVPTRTRLRIETREGEVLVTGNLELIDVRTETGTIAADVPTKNVKYDLFWTESRPRFLSDFELEKVKERSGGRFSINGTYKEGEEKDKEVDEETGKKGYNPRSDGGTNGASESKDQSPKAKDQSERPKDPLQDLVWLKLTTGRGIVLINVPPNEVSSDLRERPLTNAAKAIIRSGDSLLTEAIRRASPKYFGDYASTLPPFKRVPAFSEKSESQKYSSASVKRALISVTDLNNRAITELQASDFEVTEFNDPREILSVRPVTGPVNLVLLLDVSGSVGNYVNFIRKAARSFVDTARAGDRISIITFNEDVKVLSGFTTDKRKLSESLDTFDAGGGTAYYDALAYTLADSLRPLRGERTAIVVLTDGDDNRSFLAFDSLLGSIQESGALIYPLYVPSALIAASAANDPNTALDSLRNRYMGLTTKAEGQGEKLAQVSGGVYYPISQLSQIQTAYDDIVVQLRTAYTITFRSYGKVGSENRGSPRLKVKVNRENAFVKISQVFDAVEK